MLERPDSAHVGGTPIGRRSVLMMLAAAGMITPLVGAGTAQASADDWYPIPEESGAIPWW